MLKFNVVRNDAGDIIYIETNLSGYDLLGTPKLNKGCGFTPDERSEFYLEGLLPHRIETLEQQVKRMYAQYQGQQTNLAKNIYLNVLHDYNETLFFKLVEQHLNEMLPIIYTPTVGEAVERFSLELRKTRGLYISYDQRNQIDKLLANGLPNNVDLIVVTDGEAVLGIGDQGIGGIKICNAKLMVYTLCGGIYPHRMFPIQLDVGTNNPNLLADPMYLGWRHERISEPEYENFIDMFVSAVKRKNQNIFLHWEDLGINNARNILSHYRDKVCTFNGDMQGTGTVALASVLAASLASHSQFIDHKIVIFGAGTAGVGIADQLCDAMQRKGLSNEAAHARFWLIDKQGLLVNDLPLLSHYQKPYARTRNELATWKLYDSHFIGLLDVIKHVKPTILIGSSTAGGAFTEEIIKEMARHVDNPIILPLSNPTNRCEAKPEDLIKWTEGKALIATGSPFPEFDYEGRRICIGQSNNALAFPGIGLGALAVKAKYLSDDMLWVATETLSQCSPIIQDMSAALLPKLSESRLVSHAIALAVGAQARLEGLAQIDPTVDLNYAINQLIWEPKYYSYRKINPV